MALWKDGKGWRYEFQYQGVRYSSNYHKLKSEAVAAREKHKKKVRLDAKRQAESKPIITFSQIAIKYLDYSERRHTSQTYKTKEMVVRKMIDHLDDFVVAEEIGDHLLNVVNPNDIESYLKTRPSNHNYNVHYIEVHALFNHCIKKNLCPGPNPCTGIEKMPETQPEKYIPSEEDILKVFMVAGEDRPLLLVLFHTLARIAEILKLKWSDVNFSKKTIRLWTRKRKGGNLEYNDLPMNTDLHNILYDLWEAREQESWVFFNKRAGTRYLRRPKLMPGLCKAAEVTPFGFHSIRHFAASHLADQEKVSKKAISGLLRHKNLSTTEIYLHSIDESQRAAAEALKNFSPKAFPEKTPRKKPA